MTTFTAGPFLKRPRQFLRQSLDGLLASPSTARLLFLANLRSRHRRAFLGYAWLLIPGVVAAAAFTYLRNNSFFSVGEVSVPYPIFVLSGIFLWQAFVDAITAPLEQVRAQRIFLSLVPAPTEAVLIAALFDMCLNGLIRCLLLLLSLAIFGVSPIGQWLLIPLAFLGLIALGFSVGLLITPVGFLYDDIGHLVRLGTTFGIFLVPAIYPMPEGSLLALNPLAQLMEATRAWMVHSHPFDSLLILFALSAVLAPVGWLVMNLVRPHLSERAN